MTVYRLISSSTFPPKFAIACAAAMGFVVVSALFGTTSAVPAATPQPFNIVTLPTIVVVPDAADLAAAAALETAAVSRKRLDEV